jgi:hypothetical protein
VLLVAETPPRVQSRWEGDPVYIGFRVARNFLYIGFGFSDLDWEVVVVEAVRTAVVKQWCW